MDSTDTHPIPCPCAPCQAALVVAAREALEEHEALAWDAEHGMDWWKEPRLERERYE